MDNELKIALGKILSEIYNLRNEIAEIRQQELPYESSTIAELNEGIEAVINRELNLEHGIALSDEKLSEIGRALENWENGNNLDNFNGFNDLPIDLQNQFTQNEWWYSLKHFRANRMFTQLIPLIENGENTPDRYRNLDW